MKRISMLLATAMVLGFGWFHLLPDERSTTASAEDDDFCEIKATASIRYDPRDERTPIRRTSVNVTEDCRVEYVTQNLTLSEYQQSRVQRGLPPMRSSLEPEESNLMFSCNTIWSYAEVSHFGIREAYVEQRMAWCWDGWEVTDYGNGSVFTDTGGCGWYVSDGPIHYWGDWQLPSQISHFGWAYFETSCWYYYYAQVEAYSWGTYYGGMGQDCNFYVVGPSPVGLDCDWA